MTRRQGTERAFTGTYWNTTDDGVYRGVCCGQPLFDATAQFASGTGWPSFWEPVEENNVSLDRLPGLDRTTKPWRRTSVCLSAGSSAAGTCSVQQAIG